MRKKILALGLAVILLGFSGCQLWNATKSEEIMQEELIQADGPEAKPVPQDREEIVTAETLLEEMTLEEKVGQMFIVRCPQENAEEKIGQYHLGGYLLFGRDFRDKTKEESSEMIRRYQEMARLPLMIGVDEEGGEINRISRYSQYREEPFPTPQELYQQGGFQRIADDTAEKCSFLHELGINLNFAPVCDVSTDPSDYIYSRTFGKPAPETAQYVETVIGVMKREQMGAVLKHFPGYGNNADTHTGIACDERGYETFVTSDFLPFQAGIAAGADVVLVSHNIVTCMDKEMPASLSCEVHRILREDLSFEGLIMTDDLYMEGIRQFTGDKEAAVMAVLAGNDLICCTDFETQIPAVIDAVNGGVISEERVEQSVLRILNWKIDQGILDVAKSQVL